MTKFTLQTLALTGILAVSGLPALAADMTASPAPNAAVSSDTNAKLDTGSVGTSVDKTKNTAEKTTDKTAKDTKSKMEQTAQHPSASAGMNTAVGTGAGSVNSSAGATVR